jgi:hypothetical protein
MSDQFVDLVRGSAPLGRGPYFLAGAALYVGVPLCLGMASVVLHGLTKPQSLGSCFRVALVAATLTGSWSLVVAFECFICLLNAAPIWYLLALFGSEGLICFLMAGPIWCLLVLFGALGGYTIQARPWTSKHLRR